MQQDNDSSSWRHSHKRSRSPQRVRHNDRDVKRTRSRSPYRHKHHHHRERSPKAKLPYGSKHLHKSHFETYEALFAEYLDLQKQVDIHAVDEHEVKGRWKSFVGKWNRGELAEGWYDPEMKSRADDRYERPSQSYHREPLPAPGVNVEDEDEDDDAFGPSLPSAEGKKSGPSIPRVQDLQHKRELADEDRENQRADLRYERKQDRKTQKERLEELVPRAEPGSRERQLEKKREAAASNRSFATAKEAGAEEVGDSELMGDSADDLKAKKRAMEKQKNEREIRKEEVLRARAAEREERMAEHRRKEAKTMDMLRDLARQRFGGRD